MKTLSLACAAAGAALLVAAAGCAGPGTAPQEGQPPGSARSGTATSALGPAPPAPALSVSAAATATPPVGGSVFGRDLFDPDLTVADGSLYLRWDLSEPARFPPPMVLARADPATGEIAAENQFSPGLVSVPLYAAGSLWVTDAGPAGELLLRLDPRTLMVTGELKVASEGTEAGVEEHIAFAGNSIWVDGVDRLVQVAPQPVAPERVIRFPGADTSHVAASPDGRTLIVSEANDGAGTIQRRDPVTGALLAVYPTLGAIAPVIGGVSGASAWIEEPTGMMGYVERVSTASMKPDQATQVEGANGIMAELWDGVLWVTNPVGGRTRNYCADPATGRRLGTLPFADVSQYLLAVGGTDLYYSHAIGDGFRIEAVPIPAACLEVR